MEQFLRLLTELSNVYIPYRGNPFFYRPNSETKRILVESIRLIRSDPKIYKKLSEYLAFQEIITDARFKKYLSEISGARNPEFISVMTFKSVSGELPKNFNSRVQISTLRYFERDLAEKLLELHSILKSVPIACQGWKGNLSQEELARLIGTTSRTIRAKRKVSPLWAENIKPDTQHLKKWKIKSSMIPVFRKELNS